MTDTKITGPHGHAFLLDIDEISRRNPKPNSLPRELTLDSWIVHAPWAHPVWPNYLLCCISLRAVPGWPPAKINLEGATHEVMLFALDPDSPPTADAMPKLLHPSNFVGQFIETSDTAANERIKACVQDIVHGKLNPDTDARQQWVDRFSASNLKPGALDGDSFTLLPDGSALVKGTGATVARALEAIKIANPDISIDTPEVH
jgi:hypothetical protein